MTEKIKARDLRSGDVVRLVGGVWGDREDSEDTVKGTRWDANIGAKALLSSGLYVDDAEWPFELVRRADRTVNDVIDAHVDPIVESATGAALRAREEAMAERDALARELAAVKAERDAALATLKVTNGQVWDITVAHNEAIARAEKAEAERDEARGLVRRVWSERDVAAFCSAMAALRRWDAEKGGAG